MKKTEIDRMRTTICWLLVLIMILSSSPRHNVVEGRVIGKLFGGNGGGSLWELIQGVVRDVISLLVQGSTDENNCSNDSDCSTIYCIQAPCPQHICIDKKCIIYVNNATNASTIPCGNTTCHSNDDEYCCNPSCGICTKNGNSCIQQYCQQPPTTNVLEPPPPAPSAAVPTPSISDDPNQIVCGKTICQDGEYCCNEGCSMCARMGMMCIQRDCSNNQDGTIPCGSAVCHDGEYCCNESCSKCATNGEFCTSEQCSSSTSPSPTIYQSPQIICGNQICSNDEYCCNDSCSVCAKYGAGCYKMYCFPETPMITPVTLMQPISPPTNDNIYTKCQNDTDCPTIYCIKAPCPQQVCINHRCVMGDTR